MCESSARTMFHFFYFGLLCLRLIMYCAMTSWLISSSPCCYVSQIIIFHARQMNYIKIDLVLVIVYSIILTLTI